MIDPHWQLVDLDPLTWRHIGRFFDVGQYIRAAQPGEHGLFILHERGTVQRIVDSQTGLRRDMLPEKIDNPKEYAQELYARGEWQRVHVIDKAHLAQVARTAQQTPQREQTLDQYYHHVYQLLWGDPAGYVSIPPHPAHWHDYTYQDIRDIISNLPSSPTSLTLGVFEQDRVFIGLILVCENGQIRKVTTFEALDPQSFAAGLCEETLTQLWQHITATIAPPAGILLCSQEAFETWAEGDEKLQTLLHQPEQVYWRGLA